MATLESKEMLWARKIQTDLDKAMVFNKLCTKDYEGDFGYGKTVKIVGLVNPTITAYTQSSGASSLETLNDSSQFLTIDKQYYFNFLVDAIDKAQMKPEIVTKALEKAAYGLANQRDALIAQYAALGAGYGYNSDATAEIDAESEWESAIVAGDQWLAEQNVPRNAKKFLVIKPWVTKYLRGLLIADKTDNDELIATGKLGKYLGFDIYESNNIYNNGTSDYMLMGTYEAIAYAGQVHDVQNYNTHNTYIGTVYRGLDTYGIKVVAPKQLYRIIATE